MTAFLVGALFVAVVLLGAAVSVLFVRGEADRKAIDTATRQLRDLHGRLSTVERDLGLDSSIETWRRAKKDG